MIKCASCGRENRDTAGYCAWCGAQLAPEPEPEAEEVALLPAGPATADTEGGKPADEAGAPAEGSVEQAEPEEAPVTKEEAAEAAPPPESGPLAPQAVLAGRYEIIEALEAGEDRNVYRARDLSCCAACGYDGNKPGDTFCARCGASLEVPCLVTVVEKLHQPPGSYDLAFQEGERDYYVRMEARTGALEDTTKPEKDSETGALRLMVGHATHPGQHHEINEDSVDTWLYTRSNGAVLGLFVVADGLGGQDSGEVASRLAVDTVWEALRQTVWEPFLRGEAIEPEALKGYLVAAVQKANTAVYEQRIARGSEMSTTLTMALVLGDPKAGSATAHIANVGDSRTYLLGVEGLQRITHDHSLVQRLVDTGRLKPEEVYTHPQRNLIYQSIGDRPEVEVDTFRHRLEADERLILCSDGLWEMVRDEGMEEVLLAEMDPQRASEQLVHNANVAGGEDNITVIIVLAQAQEPAAWVGAKEQ